MPATAVRDEGALRMWVCRLPVHIDPSGCTGFTEIFGESETSHRADRVVGPYGEASMHTYPVGADDSVRPWDAPLFTGICGEFVLSHKFRPQREFTAAIQTQLLSNLLYRDRRRVV